jgi:hypothetical protein
MDEIAEFAQILDNIRAAVESGELTEVEAAEILAGMLEATE